MNDLIFQQHPYSTLPSAPRQPRVMVANEAPHADENGGQAVGYDTRSQTLPRPGHRASHPTVPSPTHTDWQSQAESMAAYQVPTQQGKESELYVPSRTLETRSEDEWRKYTTRKRRRTIFGTTPFPPNSRFITLWDGFMTGWDLTYTAFVSPVSVAFSSTDHVDGLVGVDIAASALYFIDLAMNFSVGYVVQTFDGHQIEIHDGPMIAYYYITRGTFIYDALASLAIVAEIVVISKNAGVGWRIWYALRLLRLTRVVRILKSIMSLALLNHKPQRLFLSRINSSTLVAMSLVYIFFVIVQVMGCWWWYLAEVEGIENAWPTSTAYKFGSLATADSIVQWTTAMYFAFSGLVTAMYGDVVATTIPEMYTILVIDLLTLWWWAIVVFIVLQMLWSMSYTVRKVNKMRQRLADAESWMVDNLVPLDIQQKVRQYIVELWAPFSSEDDAQQLDRLPQPLRTELVWRAAGPTFNLMRLFKTMSPEMLRWIAAGAISCRATAGQNIFSYGDESNGLVYMLQRGRATVHAGWRKVTTVYAPALLGPAALLLPFLNSRFLSISQYEDDETNGQGEKEVSDLPRACTHRLHSIIAETNCTIWILRAQDVASLVEVEPKLLHDICAEYAAYLDSLQCKQLGPDAREVRRCVGRWSGYQARSAHTPVEIRHSVESRRNLPGDVGSETSLREDPAGEKSAGWANMHSMAAAAVSYIQESDEGADEARVHNWSLPTVNEKKYDPAVRVSAVAV